MNNFLPYLLMAPFVGMIVFSSFKDNDTRLVLKIMGTGALIFLIPISFIIGLLLLLK